ncbi:tetraacyldisaccharide 4'-kinase [Massilia sp. H-1]|nr:tetraacyldisaccharide 4'-kinase [Massilia sp. H-1]
MQHYALARDVEIVLFDGRGAGNGWLLPTAHCASAPRADSDFTIVNAPVITKAALRPGGRCAVSHAARRAAGRALAGAGAGRAARLAGGKTDRRRRRLSIGNPGRFFALLRAAGLAPAELALPDHHDFLDQPFAQLDADIILITEKDAVKCGQIEQLRNDPRLWVVPVIGDARCGAGRSHCGEMSWKLDCLIFWSALFARAPSTTTKRRRN